MQGEVAESTVADRRRPAADVRCEWAQSVDARTQAELADLMNRVLERETTIGFPAPIPREQALALMKETADAVAAGKKNLLLFKTTDGQIIGHVLLTQSILPNCRHIGEVSRVFIHPQHRGPHIIKMGLAQVLARAEEVGIENIQLDVRAYTPIHRLWQSLGFQPIGIMKDYARVNGQSYDGCFMYQSVAELKRRMLARV